MTITEDIKYVGVNDHDIDLFEGQYQVENGMAYNSYVITDDKIAIFDTVDAHFSEEWLANIKNVLGDAKPDYLIIQHMELITPQVNWHIYGELSRYHNCGKRESITIMKQFFGCDYVEHQLVVKEKDTLELGKHTLTFVAAPMVHWPEVIMTYDPMQKYSSAQMHLENSVHWMLRKTGLAKQDAIISELLENTALRYRHFLRSCRS